MLATVTRLNLDREAARRLHMQTRGIALNVVAWIRWILAVPTVARVLPVAIVVLALVGAGAMVTRPHLTVSDTSRATVLAGEDDAGAVVVPETDALLTQVQVSIAQASTQARAQAKERAERRAAARRAARMAKVVWPASGPVSARFGDRHWRWDGGWHKGLDIRMRVGTPVRSIRFGTVVATGWESGYGYMVTVRHPGGYVSRYAHLSRITARVGKQVDAGDVLGRSGTTGNTTGPHLHLEILRNGQFIDPLRYLQRRR